MKPLIRMMALPLLSLTLLASGPIVGSTQPNSDVAQTAIQSAQQTPEQLQQLVAPIALYPDNLVGQILAASTYPAQVVQAQRWMKQNHGLKGTPLAQAVDQQPWDASIKALTQFPKVLANMDKNLSWTSTLGDAYVNQQQDVLDAVKVMRQHAQKAGNLQTTAQQSVTTDDAQISIAPVDPQIVYVPQYDPWLEYGYPVSMYPGWAPYPGLYLSAPGIEFGLGFGFGLYAGFGWGWGNWGMDWRGHNVMYNHGAFMSHSPTFSRRSSIGRVNPSSVLAGGIRGGSRTAIGRTGTSTSVGRSSGTRSSGTSPGAFSGFNHGGVTRAQSARGQSSVGRGYSGGGGGGSRGGGGGGSHGGGGGGRGGGGRR